VAGPSESFAVNLLCGHSRRTAGTGTSQTTRGKSPDERVGRPIFVLSARADVDSAINGPVRGSETTCHDGPGKGRRLKSGRRFRSALPLQPVPRSVTAVGSRIRAVYPRDVKQEAEQIRTPPLPRAAFPGTGAWPQSGERWSAPKPMGGDSGAGAFGPDIRRPPLSSFHAIPTLLISVRQRISPCRGSGLSVVRTPRR
jgi:hypothetical protein